MPNDGIIDSHEMLATFDVGIRSATAGNREDLVDVITIIDPTETPFLSGLRMTTAKGPTHEWQIDSLPDFGDPDIGDPDVQVTPEAYDATFTRPTVRKRLKNYTHILRRTVDVSDSQRAADTAGMDDEYLYQLRKALIALSRDIEFALVHSILNAQAIVGNAGGTPAVGRKMEGILHYLEPDPAGVSTNYLLGKEEGTITEGGSPSARLTETIYNNHCQAAYLKGVKFRSAYMSQVQKREFSGFTTNVTRNVNAVDRRQIANIDVYEGDFGLQAAILDRYIPTCEVLTLDEDYWLIAMYREILAVELARVGNTTRGMIEAELTLEARAPATGGKIVWLSGEYGANVPCEYTSFGT